MMHCLVAKEVRSINELSGKAIHIDDFVKEIEHRKKKGIFTTEFKVHLQIAICQRLHYITLCLFGGTRIIVIALVGTNTSKRDFSFEVMALGSALQAVYGNQCLSCYLIL